MSSAGSEACEIDAARRPTRLDEALLRIEALLHGNRFGAAHEHDLPALLRIIANHFEVQVGNLPEPEVGEPLEQALHRLAEGADLIVRSLKVDANFLEGGTGSVICMRVSDGRPVALVRSGRRWMVHDPASSRPPTVLDDTARRDLAPRGHLVSPGLPAKPITQWLLMRFGWKSARGSIMGNLLLNALAGLILVMFPLLTGAIVDTVVPGRETALLVAIVVFMLVLCAMNVVVRIASDLTVLRIQGVTGSMLRAAMIDRAVRIPKQENASVPPPIMALAVRAVEGWRRAVWGLALRLASSLSMALPSFVMMLVLAPAAAFAVMLAILVVVGAASHLAVRQRKAIMTGHAGPGSWMVTAYETFVNIDTVRASGAETAMFSRWAEGFLSLQERQLVAARTGTWSTGLLAGLEGCLILVAIVTIVASGSVMQVETAIPFVMATGSVVAAVAVVIGGIGELAMLSIQKKLAQPLLAAVPATASSGTMLADPQGAIRVVSVSYCHQPGHAAAIKDVDIAAEPGEFIGIAGPSGSGKTTLLQVLLGMRTPQTGAVFLDGIDIRKLDMRRMRQRIGIVGQGANLFPGTLRDNVSLGLALSDAEIWECLRMAGVNREIGALPLGLGTLVGDSNPMFSGGQIQRLLFARALALRPKLIILDEATSAIDPETQAAITRTIRGLGITIIAVAHRLETLRDCDRIYVLDRGRVVQVGTFEALARDAGRFGRLLEAAGHNANCGLTLKA